MLGPLVQVLFLLSVDLMQMALQGLQEKCPLLQLPYCQHITKVFSLRNHFQFYESITKLFSLIHTSAQWLLNFSGVYEL